METNVDESKEFFASPAEEKESCAIRSNVGNLCSMGD